MDQYSTLILIALMVVAFYFLIMRPQRKRQQEIQRTLSALTPGQRVMLGSGLFGTVIVVGQKQVVLETSPGTELTVLKQAVARVVTEADEDGAVDETDLDADGLVAEPEGPLPVEPEPIRPVNDDPEPPATGAGQRPTTAG
jgi:preprotein translocase subunit YajC